MKTIARLFVPKLLSRISKITFRKFVRKLADSRPRRRPLLVLRRCSHSEREARVASEIALARCLFLARAAVETRGGSRICWKWLSATFSPGDEGNGGQEIRRGDLPRAVNWPPGKMKRVSLTTARSCAARCCVADYVSMRGERRKISLGVAI